MKLLLSAVLLLVFFAVAMTVFKFVLFKLFVLTFWIAAIALAIYVVSNLLKKA